VTETSAGPVHYDTRDGVALVTIDNPPVNALGAGVLEAIEEAIARAVADPAVAAAVLVGARETFVAGADINLFRTIRTRDEAAARSAYFHRSLRNIESATKPIVAAIHGNALGGGLELAMACHYRVAASSARVGQPEVLLGLIPGAGGTQRLPRLVGVALALDMCVEGTPIAAPAAHAAGLVDEIVEIVEIAEIAEPVELVPPPGGGPLRESLIRAAVAFARARSKAGELRRTRDLTFAADYIASAVALCDERRRRLSGSKNPVPAPRAAVDAIESACTRSFEEGSATERELFAECLVSGESRALVHLFFAEREAARVPGVARSTVSKDVHAAAIVGAGTMGMGIAMAYANAGLPVLIKEVDEKILEGSLAKIRGYYESTMARGRLTPEALERTMSLIKPTTTYDRFDRVDVVVEAVFEDMSVKLATFAELGRVTRSDCLLASNTSTLDIDALGEASGRPAQVIGHHFFSPANVMKLVEIVRGRQTAPETIAASQKLVKRLGKVGVVVGNGFGFVANRMLMRYLGEAYVMLEEGAPVSQIDRVMIGFGMPVGPFGLEDIAGLDVGARIRRYLQSGALPVSWPRSEVADRLVAMGRYGQKSGAGWYRYEPGSRQPLIDPFVDALAEETAVRCGLERREIGDEEILERLTTSLVNEGAYVLGDGLATRAGDIDVIYCYGFGFPRHRGGPMFHASAVGLSAVLEQVRQYWAGRWDPAPLLEKLAAEQRGFDDPKSSS
jgi:3-hydroxyacyl-CoA dehydrogenase